MMSLPELRKLRVAPLLGCGQRFLSGRLLLAGLAIVGVVATSSGPVAAAEPEVYVEVEGHGWGHGRGLGQYGAQGYARNGWTSAQILDHFYGDTTAGQAPADGVVDPDAVRIEIRSQRNESLIVTAGTGPIYVTDGDGALLWAVPDGEAGRVSQVEGKLRLEVGPGCGGPWVEKFTSATLRDVTLTDTVEGTDPEDVLRLCHTDGTSTWYDGSLQLVLVESGGATVTRTVNIASIESYLLGVVPSEVPTSWDTAALEAQAVAARSYALAGDTRQRPYADTCDTILCQVYRGRYRQTSVDSGPTRAALVERSDAAVAATAGVVRLRDGAVARTEFSSSTGGYTAGGDFPAVIDEGDSISSNPNHDWSTFVDLTSWISDQNLGRLLSISTVGNGLGADGGRLETATFTFTNGNKTLSGEQTRRAFGLKSNWLSFGELQVSGSSANDAFVVAAYELFVQRPPSFEERVAAVQYLDDGGSRWTLARGMAQSDEWAGVMIDDLYQAVLGRGADAEGRGFWLDQMADGLRFESVAVKFYGSPEYYQRVGGTDEAFVASLYENILGRGAEPDGLEYWASRLGEGQKTPGAVAAGFYASIESRTDRVENLYLAVLGRGPDRDGGAYWADRLLLVDDVQLAASLASSIEFFNRSQVR